MIFGSLFACLDSRSRGGSKLSHICFADDLILFGKVSLDQVKVIKGILDLSCASSGKKVYSGKSFIFFSENVSHARRREISMCLFCIASCNKKVEWIVEGPGPLG